MLGLIRTIALVILSGLLGVIVVWFVLYLTGSVGGMIVQATPEPWLSQHFSILYYGIKLFGWLLPFVICAAIIRAFAGARAALYGSIAGLFGLAFLFTILNMATVQSGEAEKSVLEFVSDAWGRILLLLLVLPLMCAFRFRHAA